MDFANRSLDNPIEIDFGSPSLPDSSTCLLNHTRAGDSIGNSHSILSLFLINRLQDNPIELEDDNSVSSTDGLLIQSTRAGDTIGKPSYLLDLNDPSNLPQTTRSTLMMVLQRL